MPESGESPLPEILYYAITGQLQIVQINILHAACELMERLAISREMLWRSRVLLDESCTNARPEASRYRAASAEPSQAGKTAEAVSRKAMSLATQPRE